MVSAEERHFRVIVRARPLLEHEARAHKEALHVHEQEVVLQTQDAFAQSTTHTFQFDDAFDARHSQAAVFDRAARPAVESMLQGFNASIIAYGQTGAGKTFTMEGSSTEGHGAGIIPRSVRHIFDHIEQGRFASPTRFLVRAAYLQIYNESVSDLLKPERCNLTIRETKRRGLYVDQLSEWVVRSPAELAGLLSRGAAARTTAATKANEASSRSHAVFILIVEQSQALPTLVEEGQAANGARRFCVAKLNLVDLAGSERARTSGASGVRLQECKSINTSLSALGNVIFALTDTKGRPHVPYRDSKLTRLLQDSLGGNCKTTMIACASPTDAAAAESLSTLKFAHRAQHVRNHAHVNADVDQKLILHRYETELASLRTQLLERTRGVVDKRRLLEVEEQRRQAEEDKLEAIRELENRSQEVLQEKAAKRRLEAQISQMEGQLLMSGGAVAPSSVLSNEKVQREYQVRLAELEREREAIERDKEQVHRYKLLLQKQREILIALTSRLNERDETILLLQQELDIRSVRIYELEDSLDRKTAQLIHLQRVSLEHGRLGAISGERPERNEIEDWDQQQMLCRSSGASGSLEAMSITSGSGASYSLRILASCCRSGVLSPLMESSPRPRGAAWPSASDHAELHLKLLRAELEQCDHRLAEQPQERTCPSHTEVVSDREEELDILRRELENKLRLELEPRIRAEVTAELEAAAQERFDASLALELERRAAASEQELRMARSKADEETALSNSLRRRCAAHGKERTALTAILENKVQALLRRVAELLQQAQPCAFNTSESSVALAQAAREICSLQRLVGASISALKLPEDSED